MKRSNRPLFALFIAALFACPVNAQDAQKPEAQPQSGSAPAQEADKPKPGPGQEPDAAILNRIFACLAEGLPQDWKKTWFVINEVGRDEASGARNFEANFFFATDVKDAKGKPLTPCGAERVVEGVGALDAYLPEGQRRWTGATFSFMRDGAFAANYDFTPRKPAPAKPAAKAAAKKADPGKKQK